MQQISRPYQIALVVLVLAAATWFVAFGHHSSSTGGSSASSSAPSAPSQPASGSGGSSSSQIYHGSAPGVEGLTKDIAKAHAAVGTSETYAHHLEEKSAQATSTNPAGEAGSAKAPSASGTSAAAPAKSAAAPAKSAAHARSGVHAPVAGKHAATPAPPARPGPSVTTVAVGAPTGQRQVEVAVAQGKVALILFWNPAGSNDRAVHGQVHSVGNGRSGVDVFESNAKDVASFGAITRKMPVYGTPTILIIGPHRTDSLTGLQDTFSIEQAIREVRTG